VRALGPEMPELFRTASGHRYLRRPRTRVLAPWARASVVATPSGDAVLVELPGELLAADVVALDRRSQAEPHVVSALEVGTLTGEAGEAIASPYRASASTNDAPHYALFPGILGSSLSRALLAARAGKIVAPEIVATLAVEICAGLSDTSDLGALEPESVIVSSEGRAHVRGALLEHVAGAIQERQRAARPRFAYLAPELVRGGPLRKMDARGRLFALGLMLYELTTGREVIPEHPASARLLADWSFSLPELPPDAPSELRAALWGLLQRDPDRRAQPAMLLELLAPLYDPGVAVAQALGIYASTAPYL
jgi:serine/threonine protein kinase